MDHVKINENKVADGVDAARYYISYSGKGNKQAHRSRSFEILSRLKGERDVLVELKSSLLSLDINKREKCAVDFLQGVKELGLNFRSRKVPSKESASILAKLFSMGGAPKESYEIITHVNENTWRDPAFQSIIPNHGIMYYICKENTDGQKVMEDIFNGQILDQEKFDLFELFIYDCIDFTQMGVFTDKFGIKELERMLEG
ncbi:MAG: hypothetical protein N2484_09245 [Clostridia bacterium]|nr:hypothetical protein [Clostridia bacterium]